MVSTHARRELTLIYPSPIAPHSHNSLKVSACCKHFVAYDLEGWNHTSRDAYNAVVSDSDLADYYTPSFQSCVQDAHVSALMCAYNVRARNQPTAPPPAASPSHTVTLIKCDPTREPFTSRRL